MAGMERFTQRARRVLSLAHQEAENSRQNKIGTDHFLLGFINEQGGVAGRALRDLGLTYQSLKQLIQRLAEYDKTFEPEHIDLTDEAQKSLEHAVDQARRLGHHYIGTEHMLLGVVDFENKATHILSHFKITTDQVRWQVRRILNEETTLPPPIQPEMSIWPSIGPAGTNFLVKGSGFPAGEKVTLWVITPSKNERRLQQEYTVDNQGHFQLYLFSEIGFDQLELGNWKVYGKGVKSGKTSIMEFEINSSMNFSRLLRVFLCHSSADKSEVRKLYYQLKATKSIDPWLDEEKLFPGQKWQAEIPKAVRNSDIVLVCLSKNSVDKVGYIQKEIRIALDVAEEQPEDSIFIIPARLEECNIPERLQQWQWVNLYEPKGMEKLFHSFLERAKHLGLVID